MVVQTGIGRMCEGLEIPGLCEKKLVNFTSVQHERGRKEGANEAKVQERCFLSTLFCTYCCY